MGLDMVDVHVPFMVGVARDAGSPHNGQDTVMDSSSYVVLEQALVAVYQDGAACLEYVVQYLLDVPDGGYALGQVAEPAFFYCV